MSRSKFLTVQNSRNHLKITVVQMWAVSIQYKLLNIRIKISNKSVATPSWTCPTFSDLGRSGAGELLTQTWLGKWSICDAATPRSPLPGFCPRVVPTLGSMTGDALICRSQQRVLPCGVQSSAGRTREQPCSGLIWSLLQGMIRWALSRFPTTITALDFEVVNFTMT